MDQASFRQQTFSQLLGAALILKLIINKDIQGFHGHGKSRNKPILIFIHGKGGEMQLKNNVMRASFDLHAGLIASRLICVDITGRFCAVDD